MASTRSGSFLRWLLVAVVAAVGGVAVCFVLFAALFIDAVNRPSPAQQAEQTAPLVFQIRVQTPDRSSAPDVELRLDPADVAALDLATSVHAGDRGSIDLVTPLTKDDTRRQHCLAGPAEVVDLDADVTLVTIPAGICIGRGLVVPTPMAPGFEARPETVGPIGSGEPVTVTGELVVRYDGCTTIDGRRVIWPMGTSIDADGSVVHEGTILGNGSQVTARTRPAQGTPDWCGGGPPLLVEGID